LWESQDPNKERKRTKKKEMGRPVEMTPLWESTKDVGSHSGVEEPADFSTFPHGPAMKR